MRISDWSSDVCSSDLVGFTFFYTMVVFSNQNLAENLQRQGGFIPGIRPGRPTQEYITRVLVRITWGGALFLGFIAVLPFLASSEERRVGKVCVSPCRSRGSRYH